MRNDIIWFGNNILQITRWNNLIYGLSMHEYITRNYYKTLKKEEYENIKRLLKKTWRWEKAQKTTICMKRW